MCTARALLSTLSVQKELGSPDLVNTASITGSDTVTLSGGSWDLQDTASIVGNLDIDVAYLSLAAGAVLDASGAGFDADAVALANKLARAA